VTDTQPISTQVTCRACYEPTPREDLAHDEHDIRTDLCRWCAGEDEPEWAPEFVPLRRMDDLPDIDQYQEQPHA